MPWDNAGANGELAAMHPSERSRVLRSMGFNEDGTPNLQGGAWQPTDQAMAGRQTVGAIPQNDGNQPMIPMQPGPNGVWQAPIGTPAMPPSMAPPAGPAAPPPMPQGPIMPYGGPGVIQRPAVDNNPDVQTVYPAADVDAFQRFASSQGRQGYVPPDMGFTMAPGSGPPLGGRVNPDGTFFFPSAATAGTPPTPGMGSPGGQPPIGYGDFLRRFGGTGGQVDQSRYQQFLDSRDRHAMALQEQQNRNQAIQSQFGPGGSVAMDQQLRQGELALRAAGIQLQGSSWARRAQTEQQLIAGGMQPDAARRQVDEMERSGRFNGPTIDTTQIPGLPGYAPRGPGGSPASGGGQLTPAPGAGQGGGGAMGQGPTGIPPTQPGGSLITPPAPSAPPPPAPVYEALARQIESQFPRSMATTPGNLVAQIARSFPGMFADTPTGQANRAALIPYLRSRFSSDEVTDAMRGTITAGPITITPRAAQLGVGGGVGGNAVSGAGLMAGSRWFPGVGAGLSLISSAGAVGEGVGSLFRGGALNDDQEGRAILHNASRGRW